MPELVSDGGRGGKFELRDILSDEPGMSPLEIWCNESQERYVLAVAADQLPLFDELCKRERAPYAVIGEGPKNCIFLCTIVILIISRSICRWTSCLVKRRR